MVSFSKLITPSSCARFLGIEIDSVNLQLHLPEDKLRNIKCILTAFAAKNKASKKELQKLAGHLSPHQLLFKVAIPFRAGYMML